MASDAATRLLASAAAGYPSPLAPSALSSIYGAYASPEAYAAAVQQSAFYPAMVSC